MVNKERASDLFSVTAANAGLRALTLASKFALVIVLARYFAPEDVGTYGLMFSAVAIAVFALGLEYHYFTIRALIARPEGRQAGLVRDQAVLYALVAMAVLPLLGVLFWSGIWSPVPGGVLPWFFVLVVVELAAQEAGIALIALSRPLAANLVLFVRSGIWVYPVVILTILGVRELSLIFLAWFGGALFSIAVAAWCLRGIGWRVALADPVDWSEMKTGLRIAAPFVITTGASMGLLFVDRFIIEAYQGLGPVGIYTLFAGIATSLHTLVNTSVSLIRMPRLVKTHHEADRARFRHELGTMARITAASAVSLALVMSVGIVPILRIVGKAVYEANLPVFFGLLAAAMIRALADVPLYSLYAKHRDVLLLVVNLMGFLVVVTTNLVLVPAIGIIGSAIAAVTGAAVLFLLAFGFAFRVTDRVPPTQATDAPPARLAL
jgi:O-antigen/teichoic acid export membrane protein